MAQTSRSAKALIFTDSGSQSTNIATLRNNIVAGGVPTASDHNTLINMINNMLGHYHAYDDAWQLATFGNNGDRNNYYQDNYTNRGSGFPSNIGTIDSSTTITAAKHNEMAGACRAMRQHSHLIDDRTG